MAIIVPRRDDIIPNASSLGLETTFPHRRMVPFQDPKAREDGIFIDICASQPSLARIHVEGPPRVQHTAILEDDTFARVQLEFKNLVLLSEGIAEIPISSVEFAEARRPAGVVRGGMEGSLKGRGIVHMLEHARPMSDELEDRSGGMVRLILVLVVVIHLPFAQCIGDLLFEGACDGEGIDKERFTPFTRVLQAMQQLIPRRVLHVQQVHMKTEILIRIGNILRLRDRPHVPCRAIKGVPERTHACRNSFNLLSRVRDILDKDQTIIGQRSHRLRECGLIVQVPVVRDPMLLLLHVFLAPQPDPLVPEPVKFVGAETVSMIRRHMRLVKAGYIMPPPDDQIVAFPHEIARLDNAGNIAELEVALLRMGIHAERAGTRIPQL
jgi:hypothetical protein